jgi:SPP1 gp7 family putative phage head morphogenesis protein
LKNEIGSWFRKYAEDGKYTFDQARRVLTKRELREFNRKFGTKFKRLTRQRALRYTIQKSMAKLREKSHERLRYLADRLVEKEQSTFDVKLEDTDLTDNKWGEDELTPAKRVDNKLDKFTVSLQTEVERVMYTSGNADEAEDSVEDRFLAFASAMTLLLTTERVAMSSFARANIFKMLGYNHYKFVALRDERMCETCGALDGAIFPISAFMPGVTAPCLHPRCRCSTIGVR